jgi:hypothetical protein
MAKTENVPSTPLRALTMYDHVPAGCILHPVADDDSAPHLRAGEFAIGRCDGHRASARRSLSRAIPPAAKMAAAGWGRSSLIQQVMVRHHRGLDDETFIGFWARCLNFEPYVEAVQRTPGHMPIISHRSMVVAVIRECLIGRVVGIYDAPEQAAAEAT